MFKEITKPKIIAIMTPVIMKMSNIFSVAAAFSSASLSRSIATCLFISTNSFSKLSAFVKDSTTVTMAYSL